MARPTGGEAVSAADLVRRRLEEAAQVKAGLHAACGASLEKTIGVVIASLRNDGRVYLFGNGGSAADAQHLAAELEGRFYKDREPLPVQALTTNTSSLTAIGNDLGFEEVFERQVKAYVRKGDVVIAISTSGNSANVIRAVRAARKIGARVVAFTGQAGGELKDLSDVILQAPSEDTARIQECHTTLGHILCEAVESTLR